VRAGGPGQVQIDRTASCVTACLNGLYEIRIDHVKQTRSTVFSKRRPGCARLGVYPASGLVVCGRLPAKAGRPYSGRCAPVLTSGGSGRCASSHVALGD